jgi:hypothetical protein
MGFVLNEVVLGGVARPNPIIIIYSSSSADMGLTSLQVITTPVLRWDTASPYSLLDSEYRSSLRLELKYIDQLLI